LLVAGWVVVWCCGGGVDCVAACFFEEVVVGDVGVFQMVLVSLGAIGFGVWVLVKAGDLTISSAVSVAERFGLSRLFIGATIVAFGTSAPELFTSVNANLRGFSGISVGNVVGSNVANVLLVLGLSALVAPVVVRRREVLVDVLVMFLASVLVVVAVWFGFLPRWGGLVFLGLIVGYVVFQFFASRVDVEDVVGGGGSSLWGLVLGVGGLVLGSEVLVQGAVVAAGVLGVAEGVVGLTVIAFGTSVPELAACVAAARRREVDVIAGGIVGSNVFNVFSVLGVTAVVRPLVIPGSFAVVDVWVLLVSSVVFGLLLLVFGRVGRWVGGLFVLGYLWFVGFQYGLL
jgi:cation:H+ antiporter